MLSKTLTVGTKEQKAKLGIADAPEASEAAPTPRAPRHEFDERQPSSNASTILIEGGEDFEESEEFDEENEPNFNVADGMAAPNPAAGAPGRGAGANGNNRRRRRRGRPGGSSGSGGRGPASNA